MSERTLTKIASVLYDELLDSPADYDHDMALILEALEEAADDSNDLRNQVSVLVGRVAALTAERDGLREASADMAMALETACIAACNCHTKTPDPEYHAESCDYKRYRIALINYRALDTKDQP